MKYRHILFLVISICLALLFLYITYSWSIKPVNQVLALNLDNGTLLTENSYLEGFNPINQTIGLEYSMDGVTWTQLYKKEATEGVINLSLEVKDIQEGEYFLRVVGSKTNASESRKAIISNPTTFDIQYNTVFENKTLYLLLSATNISGNVKSYEWGLNSAKLHSETVKTPYNGDNITTSLILTTLYGVNSTRTVNINSSILANIPYCIINDIELRTVGQSKYKYKTVNFDFLNLKISVGPSVANSMLGEAVKAVNGTALIAYGVELIGSFYGDILRCNSGQFVKGTRRFFENDVKAEWYENNYPKKPYANGKCPYNGTEFCSDDYSIHALERSSVIEYDNSTIHWYDIPNIMLPTTFLPLTMNQTFISYIKGDNGYCWVKWNLEAQYEKYMEETVPITVSQIDKGCVSNTLPL